MSGKVYVVGVGMTKFEKPGSKEWDYPDMAKEAGTKALAEAGISYDEIEQVAVQPGRCMSSRASALKTSTWSSCTTASAATR